MRTHLIAYELSTATRDSKNIPYEIMKLGTEWTRVLDTVWLVRSELDTSDIEEKLAPWLTDGDGVIVQPISDPSVLMNTHMRWFERRVENKSHANIIRFDLKPARFAA